MSPPVFGLQAEAKIDLLTRLQFVDPVLAVFDLTAPSIGVETVLSVDQVAVILQEPRDAVRVASFFVGRQGDNQVSIRREAFPFEPDEIGDQQCVARFDIVRAASIKISVPLDELEGIKRPILRPRFNHIEMGQQKDWFSCPSAAQAGDEISLPRIWAEHLNIAGREADAPEPCRHRFGC